MDQMGVLERTNPSGLNHPRPAFVRFGTGQIALVRVGLVFSILKYINIYIY